MVETLLVDCPKCGHPVWEIAFDINKGWWVDHGAGSRDWSRESCHVTRVEFGELWKLAWERKRERDQERWAREL